MLIRLLQQETTFWKKKTIREIKRNSGRPRPWQLIQCNFLFHQWLNRMRSFLTPKPSHSIRFNVSVKTLRNLPNQEFGYDVFNKDSTSMHQLKLVFINLSLKSPPEEKEWLWKINAFGYTNPLKLQIFFNSSNFKRTKPFNFLELGWKQQKIMQNPSSVSNKFCCLKCLILFI